MVGLFNQRVIVVIRVDWGIEVLWVLLFYFVFDFFCVEDIQIFYFRKIVRSKV